MPVRDKDCVLEEESLLDSERKNSLWDDTNFRQKLILFYNVLINFTGTFCEVIPAAFFSRIALEKGVLPVSTVAIMVSMSLTTAISSAICGKYQIYCGSKKLIVVGLVILAICQAGFGSLNFIQTKFLFLTVGMLFRTVQGVALGLCRVGSLTIICHEFSDHVEKAFGFISAARGLGFLSGPVIGSLLFEIRKDMFLPLLLSSLFPMILSVVGWVFLKDCTGPKSNVQRCDIPSYIWNIKSILILGTSNTITGVLHLYIITFTTYARTIGFSILDVGTAMLTADACTSFGAVFAGYVSSAGKNLRRVMFISGMLIFILSLFTFLPKQLKIWIYLGLALLGVSTSCTRTAGFGEFVDLASEIDPKLKTNFAFHSELSGAWAFASAILGFILPLIGSSTMQAAIPFYISLIVCLLSGFVIAIVAAISSVLWRCK